MPEIDTSELDATSAGLKRQIKSFKASISGMERRIREYDGLISRGGAGYDVAALGESNDHARQQIERFQQGISVARTQIADVNRMKEVLEKKAAIAEGIVIDANADD